MRSCKSFSIITIEQVKKRMDVAQENIDTLSQEMESFQSDMHDAQNLSDEIMIQHKQILSWAELCDSASIDEKSHCLAVD